MTIVVPFLDGIPSICIELLFFFLAANVFVRHVLEKRARPDWVIGDCLAIIGEHVLHFFL